MDNGSCSPRGQPGCARSPGEGTCPRAAAALPHRAAPPRLRAPSCPVGEGAVSAADMAPGGAAAAGRGGGGGGGGSSGGVLHFVGSRCGELGTNSNQGEAQRGVHLRRPCTAPGGKRSPGAPLRGVGRRAPGLATAAGRPEPSRPPALCQNGGCALPLRAAVPPLRPWHPRPLGRGPGEPAPLCLIPSSSPCPEGGGRRSEHPPSSSPARIDGRRGVVPRREPPAGLRGRVQAAGAISMAEPGPPARPARATGGGASPPTALQFAEGRASPSPPLVCSVNNFHVWERREMFYLLLSQQYI